VAEAFIPNPLNLPEVEHKDRNRANNRASNLEWISQPDNDAKGERVHGAKLTAGQVEHVRGLLASGFKQRQIAVMFGIDQSAVSNIKRRRNWKHI
jgi:DNA invertase Pin-like site-specific DNA recombinase